MLAAAAGRELSGFYADGMSADERTSGQLTLGDILLTSGMDPADVLAIRHTNRPDGLPEVSAASSEAVLAYTRRQDARFRVFPERPPRRWLVFMDDGAHEGAHRSRYFGAYENNGEVIEERTEDARCFDLQPSPALAALKNRLVIDWTGPRRWHRRGVLAAEFRVLEIADPQVVPFPGFDRVLLDYRTLQEVVSDPHYSRWHSALSAVKGIYLITDSSNGKHYVGKADGQDGILGRWRAYALNGHGWNKGLIALPKNQHRNFMFSILRVFGPEATQKQVDASEIHFKRALLTRTYGYNAN
jgi:hypothetical protein